MLLVVNYPEITLSPKESRAMDYRSMPVSTVAEFLDAGRHAL